MRNAQDANLDALIRVIESIQDRIKRDGVTIGANETRTRDALINPLLRALGWGDSSVLTPEYLIRYGSGTADYGLADYALHAPGGRGHPVALIEAKRMREDLTDDHRDQVFYYAETKESVRYAVLTNGDCWEFYEIVGDAWPRLILDVSIRRESARNCAARFSLLRQNPADFEALGLLGNSRGGSIGNTLVWLGAALVVGGASGYIRGVTVTRIVCDSVAIVGAAAVGLVVVALAIAILRYVICNRNWRISLLESWRRLWRIGARKALIWLSVVLVAGAVAGYVTGVQTAQPACDALATLGTLVLWTLGIAVVVAIVWAMAGSSSRPARRASSRGRRRPRR